MLFRSGTLLFGAVDCSPEDSEEWIEEIHTETGLPRRFMLYDSENERIELPLSMAEELVGEIEAPISLVEVHPTHERLEMTVVYLNR